MTRTGEREIGACKRFSLSFRSGCPEPQGWNRSSREQEGLLSKVFISFLLSSEAAVPTMMGPVESSRTWISNICSFEQLQSNPINIIRILKGGAEGSTKFRKGWPGHFPACPLASYIDTFLRILK